ncbi:hypothetical protein L5515_016535 [Caenorhabditis briggsae]|uniref:Chromo domain-containing protein n=1 Tax=Caenorhabditis briggsae TaxID=6238 RepID=A0AAE9FCD3_CAEBR|nr:hypothetical protein L5515_016535 [Caenorhabditis briggsae]
MTPPSNAPRKSLRTSKPVQRFQSGQDHLSAKVESVVLTNGYPVFTIRTTDGTFHKGTDSELKQYAEVINEYRQTVDPSRTLSKQNYEIDTIIKSRSIGNKKEYLIKWKGYDHVIWNSWLAESELKNAPRILTEFLAYDSDSNASPNAPRSSNVVAPSPVSPLSSVSGSGSSASLSTVKLKGKGSSDSTGYTANSNSSSSSKYTTKTVPLKTTSSRNKNKNSDEMNGDVIKKRRIENCGDSASFSTKSVDTNRPHSRSRSSSTDSIQMDHIVTYPESDGGSTSDSDDEGAQPPNDYRISDTGLAVAPWPIPPPTLIGDRVLPPRNIIFDGFHQGPAPAAIQFPMELPPHFPFFPMFFPMFFPFFPHPNNY